MPRVWESVEEKDCFEAEATDPKPWPASSVIEPPSGPIEAGTVFTVRISLRNKSGQRLPNARGYAFPLRVTGDMAPLDWPHVDYSPDTKPNPFDPARPFDPCTPPVLAESFVSPRVMLSGVVVDHRDGNYSVSLAAPRKGRFQICAWIGHRCHITRVAPPGFDDAGPGMTDATVLITPLEGIVVDVVDPKMKLPGRPLVGAKEPCRGDQPYEALGITSSSKGTKMNKNELFFF